MVSFVLMLVLKKVFLIESREPEVVWVSSLVPTFKRIPVPNQLRPSSLNALTHLYVAWEPRPFSHDSHSIAQFAGQHLGILSLSLNLRSVGRKRSQGVEGSGLEMRTSRVTFVDSSINRGPDGRGNRSLHGVPDLFVYILSTSSFGPFLKKTSKGNGPSSRFK